MPKIEETEDLLDRKRLSKRIKELRKATGLSAEQFAFDNKIARSQYARYEAGQDIRYTTLMKLIRAFGITPSEFFKDFK
jgi:transcriptional regulator with XRE-family HTH domain